MKVLFVCGSYPPETCSNADTSEIMVNILRERGLDVEVMSNIDWSVSNWFWISKKIKASYADVIHVQYPGMGFKFSITPQLLSFFNRKKTIITIHEASQANWLRQFSLLPFSFCRKVVFTNLFERNYYKKIYPWTKTSNIEIVPIGSNIHAITNVELSSRNTRQIVHFGQIRPQKGIEQVIELAELIKKNNLDFKVIIMGRTYEKFMGFFKEMEKLSAGLPVEWLLNVSEEKVSEVMGSNIISYLPYPDGVTERRGSMFAAMVHQMVTFTTKSDQTPPDFDNIVLYKESPQQMADFLSSPAFESDLKLLGDKFREPIEVFMKKYSWESIMDEYVFLYKQVSADNRI